WLEPGNVRAPVREGRARNIRRVLRRHPNDPITIDGPSRVITPAGDSIPTELGVPGETVFRLIAGTRNLDGADTVIINRDKSGAWKIIRADQGEDDASLLLRVHGDGRIKQVGTRLGNNSLCDHAGREKCAVNIGVKGEIF